MADREQRHLMRQRGAGARDIDDFSLSIGGPSSDRAITPDDVSISGGPVSIPTANENEGRQQRFMMRQRGAGARDVDFSMNLGIPPASSPSGRASDAGSTISSSSIAQAKSLNATPTTAPSRLRQSFTTAIAQTTASNDNGTATKRRRLSPVEDEEPQEDAAIFGDEVGLQDGLDDELVLDPAAVSTSSPRDGSIGSAALTKKRRKRKSVLVKSKKRKSASASSVGTGSITGEDNESRTIRIEGSSVSRPARQALTEPNNPRQSIQLPPVSLESSKQKTAKKDDSVIGIDARPDEDQGDAARGSHSKTYSIFNRIARPNTFATAPAIPRIQREHGVANKENRHLDISSKSKVAARPRSELSGKAIKTSSNKSKTTKSKNLPGSRSTQEGDSQVVVTVRRVKHISRLDFITEEDDELAAKQVSTFRQKNSPNAVDVLAQICREIVDKRLKALSSGDRNDREQPSNSEQKRKREAVREFSEELDSRLIIMTTALDHNVSLTRKLKDATRKKGEYRASLLALRQQREGIELQQDAVRAANEAASQDFNDRFELGSRLADIELAVQRGQEGPDPEAENGNESTSENSDESQSGKMKESLAQRLQRVGELVSSANGRVGLLARVRELNRLLESVVVQRGGGLSFQS